MLEIRFHGRGGQGTVVASILLANAFFESGFQVQSFPLFGVERRGAPVEAYLRLDEKDILIRTNVYQPDHVLVQDPTLIQAVDVTKGMKKGGWILVNGSMPPRGISEPENYSIAYVDASRIALENELGSRTHPIVNTAMIGAFAHILEMPPLEAVVKAIKANIPSDPENNVNAAVQAYNEVQIVKDKKHKNL